ncbi:hypothetical protein CDAR_278961 [Caerostris darwini]|uniref:Uncharacterized protein n=1 Tax=Caerostris darwini TaxID=1538125 RepID=A0AAV4WNR6_9ARAC|nr:hypothetical protein CDAR_278961 [Caerostris darwini]
MISSTACHFGHLRQFFVVADHWCIRIISSTACHFGHLRHATCICDSSLWSQVTGLPLVALPRITFQKLSPKTLVTPLEKGLPRKLRVHHTILPTS